jgi:hypothetical protein
MAHETMTLQNPIVRAELVSRINRSVNLPLLSERIEGLIIGFLYDLIASFLPVGAKASELTSRKLRKTIISRINKVVNLPVMPEGLEAVAIGKAYDVIVGYILGYLEGDYDQEPVYNVTPAAQQYLRDNGGTVNGIKGSGPGGSVTLRDVKKAAGS